MKARLTIWLTMAGMIVVVAVIGWRHHSAIAPESQTQPTPAQASSASEASRSVVPSAARPLAAVNQLGTNVSTVVKVIVDSRTDYRQREAGVRALAGRLTDPDRETLYDFLRHHLSDDDGQLGQVLKNELLDRLCQMQPPPAGLGELLTQIYQDSGQNIVLRDYAVQHMTAFYLQITVATGVDSQTKNDELGQTRQILWQAVNETDDSIAGTALLGLNHLAQQGLPGFDPAKIGSTALNLASQSGESELTRITAFQICSSLNVKLALPYILDAAEESSAEAVRISAIGALGSLGGQQQLSFLNGIIQGNDDRLKLAAQQAFNRIEGRLQQQARTGTGGTI